MNYGQYTVENLLNDKVNNYQHFIARYNLIEDDSEFETFLIDLNIFEKMINKIIEVYENYCEECEEINKIIFTSLKHYQKKFQENLEPFHLYSFFDFNNLKYYNDILKIKATKIILEKYENNLELFTFVGILLKNMFGLFIKDADYKVIDVRKELLLTKLETF